jgi:hypothetical protein
VKAGAAKKGSQKAKAAAKKKQTQQAARQAKANKARGLAGGKKKKTTGCVALVSPLRADANACVYPPAATRSQSCMCLSNTSADALSLAT